MSLVRGELQSRGASTPQTGTATDASHGGGALLAVATTQRTTRVTGRVSQAVEAVTKAVGERTPPKETRSNSADPPTPADGVTLHILYVDASAAGPRTQTHHAER